MPLPAPMRVLRSWVLVVSCLAAVSGPHRAAQAQGPPNDIDALMERVLGNRERTWQVLKDYLLSEHERLDVTGPDGRRLYGQRREYLWVARDGGAVRSPVRFNGVAVRDADRRAYEEKFLEDVRKDESRRADSRDAESDAGARDEAAREEEAGRIEGEPRFISEVQFLRYKFEPGNYYFVGRERLAGTEVLRIEYYPRRLFSESGDRADHREPEEQQIQTALNKVTLVTLWVDPVVHQIVQSTFDNVDFSFLPGRSLVRMERVQATMRMGQPFAGIWLPESLSLQGAATLAVGTFSVAYERRFSDYRQADVQMRYRIKE